MEILVTAQEPRLDSPVDNRFGRAQWFIKIDPDTKVWEALPNPALEQSKGAGIAAAEYAVKTGAAAVISGNFGPNAAQALRVAGVCMLCFAESVFTAFDALDLFIQGKLQHFE